MFFLNSAKFLKVVDFGMMLTLDNTLYVLFMCDALCVMLDWIFNNLATVSLSPFFLSFSLWRIYRSFHLV